MTNSVYIKKLKCPVPCHSQSCQLNITLLPNEAPFLWLNSAAAYGLLFLTMPGCGEERSGKHESRNWTPLRQLYTLKVWHVPETDIFYSGVG